MLVVLLGCPFMPEIMHGRAPVAFFNIKAGTSPYDL
jgi:hypothetical protein